MSERIRMGGWEAKGARPEDRYEVCSGNAKLCDKYHEFHRTAILLDAEDEKVIEDAYKMNRGAGTGSGGGFALLRILRPEKP